MSDFYLTLPSNSEPRTNTTSKFSVFLPHRIELPGKWEVALVEIQYPFSWKNLTGNLSLGDSVDNRIEVVFANGHETDVSVPPGYYESVNDVLAAIEYGKHEAGVELKKEFREEYREDATTPYGVIPEEAWVAEAAAKNPDFLLEFEKDKDLLKRHSQDVTDGFYATFNETLKRTKVKVNPEKIRTLRFSPRLQYMLGLHESEIGSESTEFIGKYIPDLRGGFYALYVYCSLVEPQIVGNATAPLLRLVNVEGSHHGSIAEKIFHTPHYVPILCREIQRIDIEIKDDFNQYVPFDFGKTILKLHVRKRRSVL